MAAFWDAVSRAHGLLTTKQGIAAFGVKGFRARIARGQFEKVHRGLFRVAGAPRTAKQDVLLVAMARDGVAGLRSCAALNDVDGFTLDRPEILRLSTSHPTASVGGIKARLHRTNFLPPHHVTEIDGIPTTTLARALCDLSSVYSLARLERIVDGCKRRRLVEYDELAVCRNELRARGRRRTTVLDELLLSRVASFNPGDSDPEVKLYTWLVDADIPVVQQHRVIVNGTVRWLDLAVPESKVAIEYQGIDAHATHGAVVNDSEKVTELQLAGWFVALITKKTTKFEAIRQVRDGIDQQAARGLAATFGIELTPVGTSGAKSRK
ncbi:MAG: hypothetical protein QOF21_703 [Actinomycetota bacterium]